MTSSGSSLTFSAAPCTTARACAPSSFWKAARFAAPGATTPSRRPSRPRPVAAERPTVGRQPSRRSWRSSPAMPAITPSPEAASRSPAASRPRNTCSAPRSSPPRRRRTSTPALTPAARPDWPRLDALRPALAPCGALDWPRLDALRPDVDVFLYDYKATDPARHRALTGIEPDLPFANLARLLEAGASVRLRCPLVPGMNDDAEHLGAIAELGRRWPKLAIELMPYHEAGEAKYGDLGRPRPELSTHVPGPAEIAAWLDSLHGAGAPQAALG